MTFHQPSAWILLLLALLPLLWWWRAGGRVRSTIVFSSIEPLRQAGTTWALRTRWIVPALKGLAVALLIVCVARPQKANERTRIVTEGIAIQLIVDRSISMLAEDFEADDGLAAAAARFADGRYNRWFLDPLAGRGYPQDVVNALGWDQAVVETGDLEAIARPMDMLGVNYYTRVVCAAPEVADVDRPRPLVTPQGEPTDTGWEVYPQGLYDTLIRDFREYGNTAIYITENGAAYDVPKIGGSIADSLRRSYLERHLAEMHRAIADGVPVDGYFVWSLLDNFEWAHGYSMRFGIVGVDFNDQTRTIKDSGTWYAGLVARNGFDAR